WHGGTKPDYWEARSQVVAGWWTDRLRHKHLRILGGPGKELCCKMRFRADGLGGARLSPLEQVYSHHTARWANGGAPRLLALCDRGAVGTPAELGWMGTCCGPCHDRRSEGGEAPGALAFSVSPWACLALAFSPDGRTLGLSQGGVWRRDLATG